MKLPRLGCGLRGMFAQYGTNVVALCFSSQHETRSSSATPLGWPELRTGCSELGGRRACSAKPSGRATRFVNAHDVIWETFHRVQSRQNDSTRAKGPRIRSPTQLRQELFRERVGATMAIATKTVLWKAKAPRRNQGPFRPMCGSRTHAISIAARKTSGNAPSNTAASLPFVRRESQVASSAEIALGAPQRPVDLQSGLHPQLAELGVRHIKH